MIYLEIELKENYVFDFSIWPVCQQAQVVTSWLSMWACKSNPRAKPAGGQFILLQSKDLKEKKFKSVTMQFLFRWPPKDI